MGTSPYCRPIGSDTPKSSWNCVMAPESDMDRSNHCRNNALYASWGPIFWPFLGIPAASLFRERKLNTNFFFLKLFGRLRDIPAKSRDIPPKKFDFPGFEAHIELFGPHPFTWKTPTPPENIRTQKFRFGFFFRA